MFDPVGYQINKATPNQLNNVHVKKVTSQISWNFTNGNILDYGCGPGSTGYSFILPFVESTNSHLYSNDISPKMIEFSKNNFHHSRIQYKTGCYPDTFPFSNIQFDRIISVNVFHFIKHLDSTLDGLLSILKPGGQIGFTTTNCSALLIYTKMMESEKWGKYMAELDGIMPTWSIYGNESPEKFYRKIFVDDRNMKEVYFEFRMEELDTTMDGLIGT